MCYINNYTYMYYILYYTLLAHLERIQEHWHFEKIINLSTNTRNSSDNVIDSRTMIILSL